MYAIYCKDTIIGEVPARIHPLINTRSWQPFVIRYRDLAKALEVIKWQQEQPSRLPITRAYRVYELNGRKRTLVWSS